MKSRIARKLTLYFAAALLLFTLVIGTVFITLFRTRTVSDRKNDLEARPGSHSGAQSVKNGGDRGGGAGMNW
jgi:hypothetical protein